MELNKIHYVDALEAIKELKDNSIDCVITDPPYFISGFKSSETGQGTRQDWSQHTLLKPLFDFLYKEFVRILKSTGKIFMFTDWRTYPTLYLSASKYIRVANLIVWDYGWIKAGTAFRFTHELILYGIMPKAKKPKNRGTSDVWKNKPVNFTVKRRHPAEKPVDIIRKMLLESTNKGDLILDPFIGSGTTAVACKQLGRNFIGFELNEDYLKDANERLSQVSMLNIDEYTRKVVSKIKNNQSILS